MKKKIRKKTEILFSLLIAEFFLIPNHSFAATFNYVWLENIPGFQNTNDLGTLLLNLYKFGIWTVGIAAMFMLVVGGFMYITSAGNTSRAGSAKTVIIDALTGLVAALVAFLFLYVINPDLTKINLSLTKINVTSPTPTTTTTGLSSGCYDNVPCQPCANCINVTGVTCKQNPCPLNSTLASKLQVALKGQSARITESWPPTVIHQSTCHLNGTCADVNLTTPDKDNPSPQQVASLLKAMTDAGLHPIYENKNCAPYIKAGITVCHTYSTMNTLSSFHVNM